MFNMSDSHRLSIIWRARIVKDVATIHLHLTLFFIHIVRSHDIEYNDTQHNGFYCRNQPNDAQHYEFNRAVPFALEAKEISSENVNKIKILKKKLKRQQWCRLFMITYCRIIYFCKKITSFRNFPHSILWTWLINFVYLSLTPSVMN